MKSMAVAIVFVGAFLAGSGMLAAPGQNRPGEMTQARVWIENRNRNEAVPVSIEGLSDSSKPLRVEVMGTPAVTITPTTVVQVRAVRQNWDHRTVTITAGTDIDFSLRLAAADGWEAVGMQPGPQGAMVVLMKRPRS